MIICMYLSSLSQFPEINCEIFVFVLQTAVRILILCHGHLLQICKLSMLKLEHNVIMKLTFHLWFAWYRRISIKNSIFMLRELLFSQNIYRMQFFLITHTKVLTTTWETQWHQYLWVIWDHSLGESIEMVCCSLTLLYSSLRRSMVFLRRCFVAVRVKPQTF